MITVSGVNSTGGPVDYSVVPAATSPVAWKALLHPAEQGGDYTITASSALVTAPTPSAVRATLVRVTFGDVYLCSGQSNMALSTFYTFSADTIKQEIENGKYANLRLFR
jgi:hypothetical protein